MEVELTVQAALEPLIKRATLIANDNAIANAA
jgi:hypothetical protein